jgi:diguanylate cyclase (GGDEF)-like protein/PAS domain S-box-containing protein
VSADEGERLTALRAALAAEVTARAAAEAALRDNRRLLDGILSHTDIVIYAKDTDGHYLLTNGAVDRLLGTPPAGAHGRTDAELLSAEAAAVLSSHDAAAVEAGGRIVHSEELPHADGTTHSYLTTRFPLRDPDGVIYAVAAVASDVTELAGERAARAESEQRWRDLVERSPGAIAVITADGRFAYANPQALSLYGVATSDDLVGRASQDFVPAGQEQSSRELLDAQLAGAPPLNDRRRTLRRGDGELRTVEINAAAVTHFGAPAVQVELRDVTSQAMAETALQQSEQQLRASEARFQTAFAYDPAGLAVLDLTGRVVRVNPAYCQMVGRSQSELLALADLRMIAAAQDQNKMTELARQALRGPRTTATGECRMVRANGAELWTQVTFIRLGDHDDGEPDSLLMQVEDVTERRASEQELTRLALHDNLTDLPNRAMLLDRADQALARLVRRDGHAVVALLFCDLDGFKEINDTWGHAAGDSVLTAVAFRLRETMRPSDTVARLGGDEFLVLCEDLPDRGQSRQIQARLEEAIRRPISWVGGQQLTVDASIGVAFAEPGMTANDLLHSADAAMYESKRARKAIA